MRHKVGGKRLSRTKKERKALFRGLLASLFAYGQIVTTEAKAKAVKRIAEKLIAKARGTDLNSRRVISAFLSSPRTADRLIKVIAPLYADKKSSFVRLSRIGPRKGDNALMAKLSLAGRLPITNKV